MSTLPEDKEQYIEGSRKLITLLGSKKLCELGHFSPQNLTGWRKRGIPMPWVLVLKARYPRQYKEAFNL